MRAGVSCLIHWVSFLAGYSRYAALSRSNVRFIMYHGIGDASFSSAAFEKQLIFFRNHFDVIMDLMDQHSWLSQQVLRQMRLAGLQAPG